MDRTRWRRWRRRCRTNRRALTLRRPGRLASLLFPLIQRSAFHLVRRLQDIAHTYLTVSYAKDLSGVVRLRSSLRKVGDRTPHHIVVHTEDMGAFREALSEDEDVVLVSTAQVLPSVQERARRLRINRSAAASWKTRLLRLVGGAEMRESLRVRGWHFQQLSKLYAARSLPTECVVILDSDIVALSLPLPSHFHRGGLCYLYERRGGKMKSEQYARWLDETRAGLGLAQTADDYVNYVYGPVVWSRAVVRMLFEELGARGMGSLARFFLRSRLNSEYFLYGLYARSRPAAEAMVVPTDHIPSVMIGLVEQRTQVMEILRQSWKPAAEPFLWVQGYLGISDEEMFAAIRKAASAKQA